MTDYAITSSLRCSLEYAGSLLWYRPSTLFMDLFDEQQRPLPIRLPEADLLFYRHIALGDDQILLQKLKTYGICQRFTIR